MKNLLFILSLMASILSYGQANIFVENGQMKSVSSKNIVELNYNSIVVGYNSELFFKNVVVRVDSLDLHEGAGIYLDNSIIVWRNQSSSEGDLIAKKTDTNKQIKDMFLSNGGYISVRFGDRVVAEGAYEDIMFNYIKQGIYDIYINGKLVNIIYFL